MLVVITTATVIFFLVHAKVLTVNELTYKTRSENRVFLAAEANDTFLYSAFIDHQQIKNTTQAEVSVIAWQTENSLSKIMKCCVLDSQNFIRSEKMKQSNICCYPKLWVRHVICPLKGSSSDITGISLAALGKPCPEEKSYYIVPTVLNTTRKTGEIAMCDNDILYGSIDPKSLVEWFEIHRFLGVDRFTFHPSPSLNPVAKNVLRYYQHEGILELFELVNPIETFPNSRQYYNDEHAGLLDCRERHKYYDFVVDLDFDELLLTTSTEKNAFKHKMTDIFRKENVGVLSLFTNLHTLSWPSENPNHPLIYGRYDKASVPVKDRVKNLYMPSRVKLAEGMIHKVLPKQGFSTRFMDPSVATIHHFRKCDRNWGKRKRKLALVNGTLKRRWFKCHTIPRARLDSVKRLLDQKEIKDNVKKVCSTLRIK